MSIFHETPWCQNDGRHSGRPRILVGFVLVPSRECPPSVLWSSNFTPRRRPCTNARTPVSSTDATPQAMLPWQQHLIAEFRDKDATAAILKRRIISQRDVPDQTPTKRQPTFRGL